MIRRTCAALLGSLLVCGALATPASASPNGALTLPAATGPYPVGTVDLHLIDRTRRR
jgi:hypothetical protein